MDKVVCFKYWGSCVAVIGGIERDVFQKTSEGHKAWRTLKGVLKNNGLGLSATSCMYEGIIIVPTVLYGAET